MAKIVIEGKEHTCSGIVKLEIEWQDVRNTLQKPQLNIPAVMRSIYFWLYAFSKLGMLYTIFQENWIGLIGFGIATGVSYVEMMKRL